MFKDVSQTESISVKNSNGSHVDNSLPQSQNLLQTICDKQLRLLTNF